MLLTANCYENGRLVFANGDFGTFLDIGCDGLHVWLEKDGRDVSVALRTWYHYEYEMVADGLSCMATGSFTQYPVLPGYAVTINRSQGMTLTGRIRIELPFTPLPPGVIYTALSRGRSLDQLSCNRMIEFGDLLPSNEVWDFMSMHYLM